MELSGILVMLKYLADIFPLFCKRGHFLLLNHCPFMKYRCGKLYRKLAIDCVLANGKVEVGKVSYVSQRLQGCSCPADDAWAVCLTVLWPLG